MDNNREAAMILHRAYDYLSRPKGWIKGQLDRPNENKDYDAYCIMGATAKAAHDLRIRSDAKAQDFIKKAIPSVDPRFGSPDRPRFVRNVSIPSFNDAKKRTKRDVLTVMEKAIILAEEAVD